MRKFHDTIVKPGWTPGPSQTAWSNVHALMEIEMPQTIPDANDLMAFYHRGVSKARGILDSMLQQFTRGPHHLSHIRVQEMDPGRNAPLGFSISSFASLSFEGWYASLSLWGTFSSLSWWRTFSSLCFEW